MHKATLREVGGSVMVAIPPHILNELQLGPKAQVNLSIREGKLVLEPAVRRGRIGLAARLKMCDFSLPISDEERAWLDSPRAGREAL